jgi:hypothetical protein
MIDTNMFTALENKLIREQPITSILSFVVCARPLLFPSVLFLCIRCRRRRIIVLNISFVCFTLTKNKKQEEEIEQKQGRSKICISIDGILLRVVFSIGMNVDAMRLDELSEQIDEMRAVEFRG